MRKSRLSFPSGPALVSCASETDEAGVLDAALASPQTESFVKDARRESAVNLAGGLVSQGTKLLVVIYVARSFSPAQFGALSFAIAVNAFIFIVAHFGLPVYGSRAIAIVGTLDADLLFSIFGARVLLSLLGTGVSLTALSLVPGVGRAELLLVAMFGLSNIPIAGLFDWVFQGLRRQEVSAALNILWQVLWLAFVVAGTRMGASILIVPASLCVSALITAIVAYAWLRGTCVVVPARLGCLKLWQQSRKILTSGSSLGTGTLLITVLIWMDAITIRLMRGEEAVAIYAAGNRAALGLAMLANYFVQGAFPVLSSAAGHDQFRMCFQQCYEDLASAFLPISFWALFYTRELITLMFGRAEYLASVPVFRVFQLVFLVTIFANLYGVGVLVANHRDADYRRTLAISTAVFVPLCIGLVLAVGIVGAAVASLAIQTFCGFRFVRQSRSWVQADHHKVLTPPIVIGMVMIIVAAIFHLTLVSGTVLLLAAYSVGIAIRFQGRSYTAEVH
jgi:O-antigen/teichoic acid export membrane protein